MVPRNDQTEDDVKAAKAGGHEEIAEARRRGKRHGAHADNPGNAELFHPPDIGSVIEFRG